MMEKYGVQIDENKEEKAKETGRCPKCDRPIVIPSCNSCGTEPLEKKPESADKTGS